MGQNLLPLFHTKNTKHDVLDIVIVKKFVLPMHLSVCPVLISDHIPALTYITCRTSFQNLLDLPNFMGVWWVAY